LCSQNVVMKQEFKQYIKTLRCFSNSLPQDCKSIGADITIATP
jgi:hypothetical protein